LELPCQRDGSASGTHRLSPAGRRSRSYARLGEVVMVDFVATVPIETKTASRELTIVVAEADEFDQPFKTAERRRRIRVQIHHDLPMHHLDVPACADDRGFGPKCVTSREAKNESDG